MRKCAQDISLSEPIETGADGAVLELMEVIAEEGDLLEQIARNEQRRQLRCLIETCLTQQEQQVIRLRYGLDGSAPKRQREVAQITGLSRSYISRIEKRALEKLRAELEP
jgi:RNA polymerase sporulation-specific sigma factor